ncbi:hypothetical protein JXB41_06130 [Candidatus Woesearchaeota archaeon]|nr:hypothetical protein [Candidatus Woesearchaeota archaeon]
MVDIKTKINRIVVQLARDQGEVIPIEEIVALAEGNEKDAVLDALQELVEEGIISFIDGDTVQFNM